MGVKPIQKMNCKICSRCRVVLQDGWTELKHLLRKPIDLNSIKVICAPAHGKGTVFQTSYNVFSGHVLEHAKKHGKHFLLKTQNLLDGKWVKVGDKKYKMVKDGQ